MKILITGGTGFLGRHLVWRLAAAGHAVVFTGRDSVQAAQALAAAAGAEPPQFVALDHGSDDAAARLTAHAKGAGAIIHCAALASPWGSRAAFHRANIESTREVLAACSANGVARLVHISSPSVYFSFVDRRAIGEHDPLPPPVNEYARSKRIAEKLVFQAGLPNAVVLRPRAIFGPWNSALLPRLLRLMRYGRVPLLRGGRALIDLTYVDNVVDAVELALAVPAASITPVFNVTNGEPIEAGALFARIADAFGLPIDSVHRPYALADLAARGLELVALGPAIYQPRQARRVAGQTHRALSIDRAAARAKWAGIMLARVLPANMLRALLWGRAPIKVAFFLRANSNLYTTLKSRRIDFRFHDLFVEFDAHLRGLQEHQSDILVAPSPILAKLAELALDGSLRIAPRRVIAVAEVLEPDDQEKIERAFGVVVHQLYQCTEGFLAYTCEQGTLHLNEEFVHVEKEWLDAGKTLFVPVVTDFTRNTQLIVRYRLNDILRVRQKPCACGRVTLALDAIDGRSDDVICLRRPGQHELADIFPDMVRHAIAMAPRSLPDYRIEQHGLALHIAVADHQPGSYQQIVSALGALFLRLGVTPPAFRSMLFVETELHAKRRRIMCKSRPVVEARAAKDIRHAP